MMPAQISVIFELVDISAPYILIAEDDEDDQLLIRSAFSEISCGHELVFLENGIELINFFILFEEGRIGELPSLLILDLNMPRKNGQEALTTLVGKSFFREFPTVVFSTTGNELDRGRCKALGVHDFFVKPSRFSDLKSFAQQFCQLASGSSKQFAGK